MAKLFLSILFFLTPFTMVGGNDIFINGVPTATSISVQYNYFPEEAKDGKLTIYEVGGVYEDSTIIDYNTTGSYIFNDLTPGTTYLIELTDGNNIVVADEITNTAIDANETPVITDVRIASTESNTDYAVENSDNVVEVDYINTSGEEFSFSGIIYQNEQVIGSFNQTIPAGKFSGTASFTVASEGVSTNNFEDYRIEISKVMFRGKTSLVSYYSNIINIYAPVVVTVDYDSPEPIQSNDGAIYADLSYTGTTENLNYLTFSSTSNEFLPQTTSVAVDGITLQPFNKDIGFEFQEIFLSDYEAKNNLDYFTASSVEKDGETMTVSAPSDMGGITTIGAEYSYNLNEYQDLNTVGLYTYVNYPSKNELVGEEAIYSFEWPDQELHVGVRDDNSGTHIEDDIVPTGLVYPLDNGLSAWGADKQYTDNVKYGYTYSQTFVSDNVYNCPAPADPVYGFEFKYSTWSTPIVYYSGQMGESIESVVPLDNPSWNEHGPLQMQYGSGFNWTPDCVPAINI